jgi:CHRD domain
MTVSDGPSPGRPVPPARWKLRARVLCAAAGVAGAVVAPVVALSSPVSASPSAETIHVPLASQPVGTVTLSVTTTGHILATVDATGIAPGTSHAVDIQPTGCEVATPPSYRFAPVTANSTGQIMATVASTNRVEGSLFDVTGAFVVHLGSSATAAVASLPIACTPVKNVAGHRTLRLHSLSDQVAPLQGSATLVYQPAKMELTVHVEASGFAPFTQHAAHVHMGSCVSQGPILYMLPDLVANAKGEVNEVATFTDVPTGPPPSGWYLNLHWGSSSQIVTKTGVPTILFRPLLCGDIHGRDPAGSGGARSFLHSWPVVRQEGRTLPRPTSIPIC